MSTSYYNLRHPITSLRIKSCGSHDHITVRVNGVTCGKLVTRAEETPSLLLALAQNEADDFHCAAHRTSSGIRISEGLADTTVVVSERGELTTIGELRGHH